MKIRAVHDGNGNMFILPSMESGPNETPPQTQATLRLLLSSIAAGVGQALLFTAGARLFPLQDLRLHVEGTLGGDKDFNPDGLNVTIEATGNQRALEELARAALDACFPAGTLTCPLHHTVITRS